jgi:L-alanine-DL-glutamate epimerase-like enolase superfamily enzyme
MKAVGVGTQGILWSDAKVFSGHSASAGNGLMFLVTDFAVGWLRGKDFNDPVSALDALFPPAFEYARQITGLADLRKTFVLNALVPVDLALWKLYAAQNGLSDFGGLIPDFARPGLHAKQEKIAAIPLITYDIGLDAIRRLVDEGAFLMKIKMGCDPEGDNDPQKMLEWDKRRISEIHALLKDIKTPYSENSHIPYYLDANGRYDNKDRVLRLLDHADAIGALDRIVVFEEPFPEEAEIDVSDIPVRFAADESAHNADDVERLIGMGYSAIALKPIAKTLSMTFKILEKAHKRGIPCFCADLTVSPIMVDWNKNVAARLASLPGIKIGVLETNGHQYFTHWEQMKDYHPMGRAPWTVAKDGVFTLDDAFYKCSGGVLEEAPHYEKVALTM